MQLLRQRIEQLESIKKGTDIDVQLERLSAYGLRSLVDFDKYFLALFAEKEYTKVLDRISKVDESLRADRTSSQFPPGRSSGGPLRPSAVICNFCGIPGHTSFRCFRRISNQRAGRGRFFPYSRASHGRTSFQ